MRNKLMHTFIALVIAALNAVHMMAKIVYYQSHLDGGYGVMIVAAISIVISIFVAARCHRRKTPYAAAAYSIAAALLLTAILISKDIPFCLECDMISAEELGWMNKWIKTSWQKYHPLIP